MKDILMNSNENNKMKMIIPSEKKSQKNGKKEEKKKKKEEIEEEKEETEVEVKDVQDDEFSKELKKRTDGVLKGYFKSKDATQLTYSNFEKDMNAVIEGVLSEQDKLKKEKKKISRKERIKALKNKLFKRRKDG